METDEIKKFDGPWETMQGQIALETPFIITHKMGSVQYDILLIVAARFCLFHTFC